MCLSREIPKSLTYSFANKSYDGYFPSDKEVNFEKKYATNINDKEYILIIDFLLSGGKLFSPFEEYPKNQQPILYIEYTDEKGVVQFFNIGTSWFGASGVDSFGESAHAMYHVSENEIRKFIHKLIVFTGESSKS